MPLVTIESWEDETRTSKAKKEYDCTVFYGIKHGYDGAPDEPWEKPMVPWADGEWIKEIQSYGVGAKLLIKNEKRDGNWKIVSIEPWGDTKKLPGSEAPALPDPAQGGPGVPGVVTVYPNAPMATDNLFMGCMKAAVTLVTGMMNNADTFKGLIKKSANTDFIKQMTIDMANEMYREAKGKDGAEDIELKPEPAEDVPDTDVPMD